MNKNDVSTNSTFKGILKTLSFCPLALVLGIGGAIGLIELKEDIDQRKSNGLALIEDGAHLKQGNHNFVITDEFYSYLKYEDELDQKLVVDSFKQVYKNFNELNSNKLKFTLCTTSEEASKKYDLPKVNSFSKYDVPFYITEEDIEGKPSTIASTKHDIDYFTRELNNESILFKKNYLFAVYNMYDTTEEIIAPSNSLAYTVCAHETMHAMGFAHQSKDSILYPYMPSPYKDFTEKDKELLVKYNQTFYNATPDWVTNQDKSNNQPKQEEPQVVYTTSQDNSDEVCR